MAKSKGSKAIIEVVRGIGADFLLDNIKNNSKKKISVNLEDINTDDIDIISLRKTFKVANYSNTSSSIIGKMNIEIEGVPTDNDKSFGKKLNHYFK